MTNAGRKVGMAATDPTAKPQAAKIGSEEHVRFIILTYARAGSTMLASLLNSSPNITCFRELFNPIMDGIGYHVEGYDNSSAEDLALRNSDLRKFLRERIFCRHPEEIRAVGFKAPHVHFSWFPGLLEGLVEDTELRVLHLRRHNLLRMLVSLRIAQKTGGWSEDRKVTLASKFRLSNVPGAARHPLRTANRLRKFLWPQDPPWRSLRAPVVLSETECREFFEEVERDSDYYGGLFHEHPQLTLYFEDLLDDRKALLNRVQSFLDLKPRRLAATTRRQNPEPLRDLIANYDELYAAFKDSPEAAFFD